MNHHRKFERGQVLILMVFGLVGLIGFAALAIDGGMLLSDRRHEQNTADASALAGAWVIINSFQQNNVSISNFTCPTWETMASANGIAVQRAAQNNIEIDDDQVSSPNTPADKNGVWIVCTDYRVFVHVMITKPTQTSLIHLFYNGPAVNTVEAVAEVTPQHSSGNGSSLVATSTRCKSEGIPGADEGIVFGGIGGHDKNFVYLEGGGIFSNSCIAANGGPSVQVNNGTIKYVKEYIPKGQPDVDPAPSPAYGTFTYPPLNDVYDCTLMPVESPKTGTFTGGTETFDHELNPGRYTQKIKITGGSWIFRAGLYCLNGLEITGGKVVVDPTIPKDGITIIELSGDISISGNTELKLRAPNYSSGWVDSESEKKHAYNYLLVYIEPFPDIKTNPIISLLGNDRTVIEGTIYAPNNQIILGGDNSTASGQTVNFGTSVIGYSITFSGSISVKVTYNQNLEIPLPSNMGLYQ